MGAVDKGRLGRDGPVAQVGHELANGAFGAGRRIGLLLELVADALGCQARLLTQPSICAS
jgi:hypothetical protein